MAIRAPDAALIPSVNPTAQPAPPLNIQVTPGAAGVGVAQAQAGVGKELGEFGDMLAKHAVAFQGLNNEALAKDADVAATQKLSQAWMDYSQLKGKAAIDGFSGFTKHLSDIRTEIGDTLPNEQAKKLFDDTFVRRLDYMQTSGAHYAGQQRDKWLVDASKARANTSIDQAVLLRNNPSQVELQINTGIEEVRASLELQRADPDTIKDKITDYRGTAYRTTISALAQDDLGAAQKLYERVKPELGGLAQASIEGDLARYKDAGIAAFRGDVVRRYNDRYAEAADTGNPVTPLSDDEIRRAFPNDEGRAEYMIRAMRGAVGVGQATNRMGLTSPEEDMAAIARFRPVAGAPDYSDQANRFNSVITAYQQKQKELTADPAAYALRQSPALRTAFDIAQKDPKMLPSAIDALDATYDKLGVPISDRQVLTLPQAQALSNDVSRDPENAPQKMKQLEGVYGTAWPRVWRDMTQVKGGLPVSYQAVGVIDDERQAALLARGLAERGKTGKNLTDLLLPHLKSKIDDAVEGNPDARALLMSLSRSGADAEQTKATLDAIKTLAYANAVYDGADQGVAQDKAVSAFTKQYQFMPDGGARVPVKNYDAVSANARVAIDGLNAGSIMVPPIYGKPGQASPDEYVELLRAAPTWITSPRADALWLLDNAGRLVRDPKGAPFAVPFAAPAPTVNPQSLIAVP